MWCPYCAREKDQVSAEHVFTRALGANVEPTNPFLLDVCAPCNSACGNWVDGPFVRSFLVHNARAQASELAYDPAKSAETIVPLYFLGRLRAWPERSDVCDFWLGPTGDHIFHFHRAYPDDPPFAGRPPGVRREALDAGAVYVRLIATNPVWHPIIVGSIRATFGRTTPTHFLNAAGPGQSPPAPPIPAERQHHADWIATLPQALDVQSKIDITAAERFVAKLALGFGARVLGDRFARSEDADLLRRALWERDRDARAQLEIPGVPFFAGQARLAPVIGWAGCHIVLAKPVDDALALTTVLYSRLESAVRVTSTRAHWESVIDPEGTIWVIAPGLRRFAGPMSFDLYLEARIDPRLETSFEDLARRVASAPKFPAFHLPA